MDTFNETAYILEEAMEGFEGSFNASDKDGNPIKPGDKYWVTARQWSLSIMNQVLDAFNKRPDLTLPSEVAEFDKAIDGVVFNIGKLAKMGLTEAQIHKGFQAVYDCNMAKLGGPKDDLGKQLKPEGWTGPEDNLQEILNGRIPTV